MPHEYEYVKNASRMLRGELTELEQARMLMDEQKKFQLEAQDSTPPTRESTLYEDMGTSTMRQIVIDRRPLVRKCKVQPNDLCPCGSGKKFKKCCMGHVDYTGYKRMDKKSY